MGTKTISLEDSAYMRLKAAKRAGESFSEVVNRILTQKEPSFLDFRGLLQGKAVDRLAETVARMKQGDVLTQKLQTRSKRKSSWASP